MRFSIVDVLARLTGKDALSRRLEGAPIDDEPLTAAEVAAIQESRAQIAAGEFVVDDPRARPPAGGSHSAAPHRARV
jgi:hypothetical protein